MLHLLWDGTVCWGCSCCAGTATVSGSDSAVAGCLCWGTAASGCTEPLLQVLHTHLKLRCFVHHAKSNLGRAEGQGTGDGEQRTKMEQTDTVHEAYVTWRQEVSWARSSSGWWCYLHVHTTSSAGDDHAVGGCKREIRSCISKNAMLRQCEFKTQQPVSVSMLDCTSPGFLLWAQA